MSPSTPESKARNLMLEEAAVLCDAQVEREHLLFTEARSGTVDSAAHAYTCDAFKRVASAIRALNPTPDSIKQHDQAADLRNKGEGEAADFVKFLQERAAYFAEANAADPAMLWFTQAATLLTRQAEELTALRLHENARDTEYVLVRLKYEAALAASQSENQKMRKALTEISVWRLKPRLPDQTDYQVLIMLENFAAAFSPQSQSRNEG